VNLPTPDSPGGGGGGSCCRPSCRVGAAHGMHASRLMRAAGAGSQHVSIGRNPVIWRWHRRWASFMRKQRQTSKPRASGALLHPHVIGEPPRDPTRATWSRSSGGAGPTTTLPHACVNAGRTARTYIKP